MTTAGVLFIDDEEHLRIATSQSFELAGIPCAAFADGEAALAQVGRSFPGVIVSDIRMPGIDGLEVLRRALEIDPELPVILVTGHGDIELAVSCLKDGAYDFIEKPFEPVRLVDCAARALEKRRLTLENRALRRQIGATDVIEARIVGRSPAIVDLRHRVRSVAATDADVLITGDTGTGKEVVARAIHRGSERAEGPFVHVNCAALPEALVESELFGHEAGAFPGAARARVGKFEHARRGVLCLDEIDSLSIPLQAKLLGALQERSITRLGSNDPVPLDMRVIALSKSDLVKEASEGRFRPDLLYRLNVVTLRLPRLDERREDVPLLFSALIAEAAARYKTRPREIPGAVLASLSARDWPGNVRELRNAADRFLLGLDLDLAAPDGAPSGTLAERMASHEKAILSAAIAANGGRLKEVYETLGLSRKALYEKMRKHGLSREDYV